jgi:hypothetical protein
MDVEGYYPARHLRNCRYNSITPFLCIIKYQGGFVTSKGLPSICFLLHSDHFIGKNGLLVYVGL